VYMDIRTLIEERFAPTVLVTATPAAEALVQTKNGLSIVDILRPYSHVRNLNGEQGNLAAAWQYCRHLLTTCYVCP
jgi:hypothetical protein